tara:strand:- start:10429 stop:10719 length:291 start_codon:yes stop_codon:yes gene_type:complete
MTSNQKQALDYINKYWAEKGHSPSYRDISSVTRGGLGNAFKIVNDLQQRGFIHIDRGKARAIYPMNIWYKLRGQADGGNKTTRQTKTEEPPEETGA